MLVSHQMAVTHSSEALAPRLSSQAWPAGPQAVWAGFTRLRKLSFPRRFPLVQFPNLPLILAFIAGEAGRFANGTEHTYTSSVAYLAMTIWAYEELAHGVNWFRHLLGLAYVIILVMRVAHALHA